MKTAFPRISRRVLVAAASLLIAGAAGAAEISIDERAVEPLPGRDYSMRLDLAAARFEQYDVRDGVVSSRGFSSECAASLTPGLWLAVPADGGKLDLLPVGTTETRAEATRVAPGCRIDASEAATLPPALLQQIAAQGGGVIFVDNSTVTAAAAGQVAAIRGAD
jgi:hypothetical protein